jgi:hypothetical protein
MMIYPMHKQFFANTLFLLSSLMAVFLVIAPASAQLKLGAGKLTNGGLLQNTGIVNSSTSLGGLTQGLTSTLQETTLTNVGSLAGASTDSLTTVTVGNLTQPQLPSLTDLKGIIQQVGQTQLDIQINNQGVTVDANANLNVGVGNLANVGICLDASAAVGSPAGSSLANCEKKREIPEPGGIGGLVLLGIYLSYRKIKFSEFTK